MDDDSMLNRLPPGRFDTMRELGTENLKRFNPPLSC